VRAYFRIRQAMGKVDRAVPCSMPKNSAPSAP